MKQILVMVMTLSFMLGMTAYGQTLNESLSLGKRAEISNFSLDEASQTAKSAGEGTAFSSNGAAVSAASNPDKFNLKTKTVMLNSGYEMPIMGLGTYSLSDEECYKSVTALLEAGGRLIQ